MTLLSILIFLALGYWIQRTEQRLGQLEKENNVVLSRTRRSQEAISAGMERKESREKQATKEALSRDT